MLIDEVLISAKAGNGGDGSVSFRREKYVPRGGPDGGNGGKGGDVYLVGTSDLTSLKRFRYEKNFTAEDGKRGQPRKKAGRDGKDLKLLVPVGTLVTDVETEESLEILKVNKFVKILSGGKGGRGNFEFRSSRNTKPIEFEQGEKGEARKILFELQLIADVGFIGLPNAGKTSLLNKLTKSKSKIANYPFTTLEPNLGTIDQLILADIPGLIEGAAQGKGLGHKFLKHIRRTKMLVHCISCESENIKGDYKVIRRELKEFDKKLKLKKEVILLTKSDLVSNTSLQEKLREAKTLKKKVLSCSIFKQDSLKEVKKLLVRMIGKVR